LQAQGTRVSPQWTDYVATRAEQRYRASREIGHRWKAGTRTIQPIPGLARPRIRGPVPHGKDELSAELERSRGLLQDFRRRPADQAWSARQIPDLDSDPLEPLPAVKKEPEAPGRRWQKVIAALLVGLLASFAVGWVLLHPGTGPDSSSDSIGPRWKDESTTHFSFAVASDFGEPGNVDSIALAARARASGASFLVALGDLAYPDEAGWCQDIRRYVPEVAIVAGNHDDGEIPDGELAEIAETCPYTLPTPFGPGNGTAAYGYEYYFDYPRANPLARFIMISAGLEGPVSYDYSEGAPHEEWVEEMTADARDREIPWVIVGVHKQCITVGAKDKCSMGDEIFEELVQAEVDLILVGHDRVYERSKQLDESDSCDSVEWTHRFVPDCVVSSGSPDAYLKGKGTVVVVQGVGGHGLDNVTIDGSDPEIGYFDEVMGRNANTEERVPGFGSVFYKVTTDSITAETDFCPAGTVAANGQCPANRDSVFMDRFAISSNPSEPVPSPRIAPPTQEPGAPINVSAADAPRVDGVWAVVTGLWLLTRSSLLRPP
jgi:calcineurin-like phosphoesterase family protein